MRLKARLKSNTGEHELNLDLTHVEMTNEQRTIADKLFKSIGNRAITTDVADPCEVGKCLASEHLSPDEFSKVRGLKARLGTSTVAAGIIADFCLHIVKLPN